MKFLHATKALAPVVVALALTHVNTLDAGDDTSSMVNVPEAKRTELGLYVTAAEAYRQWKADPDGVKIIDVRTPEEYIFFGAPCHGMEHPIQVHPTQMGCRGEETRNDNQRGFRRASEESRTTGR
jgi:hypothetical protein